MAYLINLHKTIDNICTAVLVLDTSKENKQKNKEKKMLKPMTHTDSAENTK